MRYSDGWFRTLGTPSANIVARSYGTAAAAAAAAPPLPLPLPLPGLPSGKISKVASTSKGILNLVHA